MQKANPFGTDNISVVSEESVVDHCLCSTEETYLQNVHEDFEEMVFFLNNKTLL